LGKGEGNRTEGARPLGRERTRMVSASDRGGLEGTNRRFVTGRRFPSLAFKKVGIVRRAAPTFFIEIILFYWHQNEKGCRI
jgi:hypothetical protein